MDATTDDVTIAPAGLGDVGEILTLQRAAYVPEGRLYDDHTVPGLTQTLVELLADLRSGAAALVARDAAGRAVGSVRWTVRDGVQHIGRLVVAPDRQGHGIGTALLRAAEAAAPDGVERSALFTGHLSAANLRLYEREGYRRIRTDELRPGLTLVHLEKQRAPRPVPPVPVPSSVPSSASAPSPAPDAELRAVEWTGAGIRLLDQTLLPGRLAFVHVTDVDTLVDAVRRLVVRGAPALGAVGALGVVVALREAARKGWDATALGSALDRVRDARPTAVNLAAAVDAVRPLVPSGEDAVLAAALRLVDEDVAANHAMATLGADWVLGTVARRPVRVLTHCNTGFLATTAWGTALGIVRELHRRGVLEVVYADETRPLLQGARLTAWELAADGIPHLVQADGAAASTILGGLVDVAIVGADRVAANGDTANKIGTLGVALACHAAGIPFVVAAPESTVDAGTATGADIPIELRAEEEVLEFGGVRTAPAGSLGFNPAFDVTPARYVTALVTQSRVLAVSAGNRPA